MTSFLSKKSEAEELIRFWKLTLTVEEALNKSLMPVTDKAAALEGRRYFKYLLPEKSAGGLSGFLLRQLPEMSIPVDVQHLPFLRHLSHQDALSRKYRQPIVHDFLVGFPAFYYRDRYGNEKLSTLFKFSLADVKYPTVTDQPTSGFQSSIIPDGNDINLTQDIIEEEDIGSPYWLDELFLDEQLGVLDDELYRFRRQCVEGAWRPETFIYQFCLQVLKANDTNHQKEGDLFEFLLLSLKQRLAQTNHFALNRQPARVFSYGLVYELENNQPTRQLQNDLSDVINRDLLKDLKKSRNPARYYVFGKNKETAQGTILNGQYNDVPLTASQRSAVMTVPKRDFTVINGPPGTGKTHIIRNLMAECVIQVALKLKSPDDQLTDLRLISLVTSTNNRAVDNALEGMDVNGLLPLTLRVGSRIVLSAVTVDFLRQYCARLKDRIPHKSIKDFFLFRKELKDQLKETSSKKDVDNRELSAATSYQTYLVARKVLDAWVGSNKDRLLRLIESFIDEIEDRRGLYTLKNPQKFRLLLTAFPLVGCTLLSLRNFFPLDRNSLGMVIIDEAGQCIPSYSFPALLRAVKGVMIGDTMQLEPIAGLRMDDLDALRQKKQIKLTSDQVRFFSTGVQQFRSSHHVALECCHNVLELKEHFRCRPDIIAVSQDLCGYDLNVMTSQQTTTALGSLDLQYVDIAAPEKRQGSSWLNEGEVGKILTLIKSLDSLGVAWRDIAVLTPYRAQLSLINAALKRDRVPVVSGEGGGNTNNAIATGTVHRFQGGERQIVLFSHVITEGEPLFLNSRVNLLNVAVSRAQMHFIFVGSLNALSRGAYTAVLRDHLLRNGEPLRV